MKGRVVIPRHYVEEVLDLPSDAEIVGAGIESGEVVLVVSGGLSAPVVEARYEIAEDGAYFLAALIPRE